MLIVINRQIKFFKVLKAMETSAINYKYLIYISGIIVLLQSSLVCGQLCNECVADLGWDGDIPNCNCNEDPDLIYDYNLNTCGDVATIYKSSDFCGMNAEFNETSHECFCSMGWTLREAANVCDIAIENMCEAVVNAEEICNPVREDCVNTPGVGSGYLCTCKPEFYKAVDTIECYALNEEVNPQWNGCSQIVNDGSASYTCSCFNDCFNDCFNLNDNGYDCDLDEDCELLTDSADVGYVCVANKTKIEDEMCDPLQGYTLLGDGSYTDINECADESFLCFDHSTCLNLDEGQGYDCVCVLGFSDFNGSLPRECVRDTCTMGTDCTCKDDPCSDENNSTQLCISTGPYTVQYNVRHDNLIEDLNGTAFVVTGNMTVVNGHIHTSYLMQSLDALLSTGVTQADTNDNVTFFISIVTNSPRLQNLTADSIQSLVAKGCNSTTLPDTNCYLPYGIIVKNDFNFYSKAFCSSVDNACDDDHSCVDTPGGKYICDCRQSSTQTYFNNVEQCGLAADLRYYQDVTIGLSVTMALLCLAAIGGFIWQFELYKVFSK